MQTKKIFVSLSLGALLLAGLFVFLVKYQKPVEGDLPLKPSQVDFTNSNELQEPEETILGSPSEELKELPFDKPVSEKTTTLSESEKTLWKSFEAIIKSRNDNDPRVGDLKNLSSEFRNALAEKYRTIKPEDRNSRGFIVFLIAKDVKSSADLEFLQTVYQEQPCFSLENCSGAASDEDPHMAGVNQTTLHYPQIAGLYQLEKQLESKPELLKEPALRAGVLETLKQAETFSVPAVRERAEKIRARFKL